MTILLLIAVLCLAFSVFCVFGLPYMLTGPRVFDEFSENREQQVMAGVLGAVAIALVCAPISFTALISTAEHMQVFTMTFTGLGWA